MRRIVLASTSRYRRELIERLGLPFEAAAPRVEESPIAGEHPAALVRRRPERALLIPEAPTVDS